VTPAAFAATPYFAGGDFLALLTQFPIKSEWMAQERTLHAVGFSLPKTVLESRQDTAIGSIAIFKAIATCSGKTGLARIKMGHSGVPCNTARSSG
jgi:hypothetical protein